MANYGRKYQISFSNHLSEDYYVMFNKKNYTGDTELLTAVSLSIKSIGNDDQVWGIMSRECNITINSNTVDIFDFQAIEDDEWSVVVYRELDTPPIFDGFIIVEDCSQPMYDKPFNIEIRATDGLSFIKNVPLQKSDGTKFVGLNNITDYLGHILYYVHPGIDMVAYSDIYHIEMVNTTSPLEQMQVNAKTFEKDETTFINAYEALDILCNDLWLRIFYENGAWRVVSSWQYRKDYGFNSTTYSIQSNVVTKISDLDREILLAKIGKEQVIEAVTKDATIYSKLATKSVKKSFTYEIPKELVKNQTFQIGANLPALSGSYIDTTVTPNQTIFYQGFVLDGWLQSRGKPYESVGTIIRQSYVRKEFDFYNYVKDKFVVIPTQVNNPSTIYLYSSEFPVGQSDKLNISIDQRLMNNYSGNQTMAVFSILLKGDNGTFWSLDDNGANGEEAIWFQNGVNWGTGLKFVSHYYTGGDDKDKWVTTIVNSSKIPTNGTVKIMLYEGSANSYPNETWYKNLRIEYKPYIAGGYAPVSGDYNIYSQNLKINQTVDETVSISDSPKKIIKGALFVNGQLASPEWRTVDVAARARFTQLMTYLRYNYTYRQYHKIEGTLKGLSLFTTSGDNIPFGFLPQYTFTDLKSDNTRYILCSMDIDYVRGTWRGVFVEVRIYGVETFDTYDFSYLFEQ